MAAEFPTSIHDTPLDDISLATLKSTKTNNATYDHAAEHVSHTEEIIATQRKIGTGSSTPTANTVLFGNGTGTSTWSNSPTLGGSLTVTTDLTVDTNTLVVDSTNNRVGIVKASPSYALDMTGDLRLTGSIRRSGGTAIVGVATDETKIISDSASGKVSIYTGGSGAANEAARVNSSKELFVFDSTVSASVSFSHSTNGLIKTSSGDLNLIPAGNVSIGDGSSNFASLNVYSSTTNFGIEQISSDAGSYISFQDNTTTGAGYVYVGAIGDDLIFGANNRKFAQIDSTGVFTLYDATVVDTLTAQHTGSKAIFATNNGDIEFQAAGGDVILEGGNDLVIKDSTNTDSTRIQHDGTDTVITNNGSGDIVFTEPTGGNVKPSTDAGCDLGALSNRWQDVYASNGTIQTSDIREKTIVGEVPGLEAINQLETIRYTWKTGKNTEEKHYGVSAQQTIEILGEDGAEGIIVHDKEQDKYGARYEELVPLLIKAVQELSVEVEELKQKAYTN